MNKLTLALIERMRLLEKDHEPDGWPAVKMSDISSMINIIEEYDKNVNILCEEWALDHTHLQNIARKYHSDETVYGGSHGVPSIQDLADMIDEHIYSI